ncbi:gamma-butyrobetaine dioxygenase-like [Patiria miniata]|uniref:Gamma-butyrobetaine dioxygenase n=1 Tax=Patiria miniata TaxID=46514 RepID=A0A913ZMP9_PATMI|nr:gamma-butyrobetaine dioxygenase-like [Patiria miniata]
MASDSASRDPILKQLRRVDDEGWFVLEFDNGYTGRYPYVWMRDNCRCSACYHPSSWQRTSHVANLDPEVLASREEIRADGAVLAVDWSDGHRSEFQAEWLNRQRFAESVTDHVEGQELQTWGAEMSSEVARFDFQRLLVDEVERYKWLSQLFTKGIALVQGAPCQVGTIGQLAKSVAYLRTTCYGDTFQVFSKPSASSIAFTPKSLGLHIDLLFYEYCPGIQMLHCIQQAGEGGDSQFVDGLNIAEQLRRDHPAEYQLLRTLQIDFRDAGDDYINYHLKTRRPMIQYDRHGKFQAINYSDHCRSTELNIPVEDVKKLYKAIKVFNTVMYRPENVFRHRLAAGEIITFSNGRVMHGRSAFKLVGSQARHLEGGYFDWDEGKSAMRLLREKLYGEKRL